jgi:hypothetical protein
VVHVCLFFHPPGTTHNRHSFNKPHREQVGGRIAPFLSFSNVMIIILIIK